MAEHVFVPKVGLAGGIDLLCHRHSIAATVTYARVRTVWQYFTGHPLKLTTANTIHCDIDMSAVLCEGNCTIFSC